MLTSLWADPGAFNYTFRPSVDLNTFNRRQSDNTEEKAAAAEIYDLFTEPEVHAVIGTAFFRKTVGLLSLTYPLLPTSSSPLVQ